MSATGHFGFSDFYVAAGLSLNVLGGGTLDANGLTFSGTTVVNGSLTLNNSVERMTVEGDLTVNGSFDWRGGDLQGEGTTYIPAETTLTISGTNHHLYDAQQLENAGTVLWTGGDLRLRDTSAITNLAGATFEVQRRRGHMG